MCVAVLCKKGIELKKHYFDSFSRANNDGFGFAYVRGKTLTGFKTMNIDEFYQRYKGDFLSHGNNSPFIIHFRLGTQGTKDVFNCHPFFPTSEVAMIHNGCMPFHASGTEDKRSDTHIFAMDHLANIPTDELMHNPTTKKLLEDLIGNGNKIVLLDSNKDFNILNEQCGHWLEDKSIWFSNTSYMYSGKSYSHTNSKKFDRDGCVFCNYEFRKAWLYNIMDDYGRDVYVCKHCMSKYKDLKMTEFFNLLRTYSNTDIGKGDL